MRDSMLKYNSPIDAYEQTGDGKAYYLQWKPVTLEIGKTYFQAKGNWQEKQYKVLAIVDDVAVCEVVNDTSVFGLSQNGLKCLFHVSGYRSGWKYGDDRSIYRLQE